MTYTGKVSDGLALAATNALTVSIPKDGGGTDVIPITPDGSGNWTYTFDATGKTKPSYTLTFTATDSVGKQTSITRTIDIDGVKPTIGATITENGIYNSPDVWSKYCNGALILREQRPIRWFGLTRCTVRTDEEVHGLTLPTCRLARNAYYPHRRKDVHRKDTGNR